MKIVVGLGNPEKKYLKNFHNMGFMAVSRLAEKCGVEFRSKPSLRCFAAEGIVNGEKFMLVMPTTFMNLSGEAVRAVMDYYKVTAENVLIVYDDLDVSIGEIRYREKGSAGSHNGMKNIVALTGCENFKRIRIGIKKYNELIPTIDYVLSDVPKEFQAEIGSAIERAAECAYRYLAGESGEELMQSFNGKSYLAQ